MAKSTNYYNVDDFNKYKKSQGKCIPPRINVLTAAMHIQTFFDNKKFTFGFMGGLPMLCLGYKREMPDLHIVYDGKDFERLQAKLGSDRRVRLPIGMNPLLPFKILVWTGPSHKDYGCTVDATIELDFVPSGTSGSPVSGELARSLVLLGLQTSGGKQMVFKSLNTQYLMATLLSYCKARDLLWDPRKDILYLCKHETEEVHRTRGQINNKEVKEMFLGTSFFSRLDMDAQRLCYHTLLNTQPPPTMSITPPSMSIAPPTPQNQPIPQAGPEGSHKDVDPRLPRSRYRKAAGQRSSSGSAADRGAQVHTKAQSVDHLQDPRRLSYIEGVQYVRCAKAQAVLVTAVNKNARNSMPNLTVGHHALQSRYGSDQDVHKARPQEQIHKVPRTSQAHDRPSSSEPQSTHTSSRLIYGADFLPAYMDEKDAIKRTDRNLEAGDSRVLDSADPTEPAAHAMRSQKGSLHDAASPGREQVIPQQVSGDTLQSQRGKLHLVGPEGVYGAPQAPPKTGQMQIEHQRHHSAPSPQTRPACVFELDAGAPLQTTIVVELPANSIAPLSTGQHTTQDETAKQPETLPRPSTFRASSAPLGDVSLPAILVVGRPGTHAQRQPPDQPRQPAERESTFSTHQTNAYRYSSYVFPSHAVLETSQEGPAAPTYKAYRPFVLTNELNRNDSVSSVYSPAHKRDASDDSTASYDSTKLAKEYQELLQFERGYGSS